MLARPPLDSKSPRFLDGRRRRLNVQKIYINKFICNVLGDVFPVRVFNQLLVSIFKEMCVFVIIVVVVQVMIGNS
jgi:hypothetical protein